VLAGGVIVVAGLAAYANSFRGPLIYDDIISIRDNPTIRDLSALGRVLSPPCDGGTLTSRPLLNLSLAINYCLGREDVWGYHATNLAIHLINGLLLLGLLRRTFQLPSLRPRYGQAAWGLAVAIALLWTVHPLQTESVTYVSQRAESLAALFYLLVLYSIVRGSQSPHAVWWNFLAAGACVLGVGVKETLVTAPVVVLLFDRMFLEESFGRLFRRRWGLYVGLFSSWGFQAGLLVRTSLPVLKTEIGSIGVWAYARSQPGVLLHYLRLSLWPDSLCLSYDWPVATTAGAIVPGLLAIGVLGVATVWGLAKRRQWAFLTAWFFLILAPTSSIMPLPHLAFEHRMYLPLAGVLTLVVVSGYAGWRSIVHRGWISGRVAIVAGMGLLMLAAIVMGCLTFRRNLTYQSMLSIWEDTARKAPHNVQAHSDLGGALFALRRVPEAIDCYREAIRIKPDYADAHANLGAALGDVGRNADAIASYQEALRLDEKHVHARVGLATLLSRTDGRIEEALAHFRRAMEIQPEKAFVWNAYGSALITLGRISEAIEACQKAVQLEPRSPINHNNLGLALADAGRKAEAIEHYQQAVNLQPGYVDALNNLANALCNVGRTADALEHYRRVIELCPDNALAHYNWANALIGMGQTSEAIAHYEEALRIQPDSVKARNNLAGAYLRLGRPDEAIKHYEEALKFKPDLLESRLNLGLTLTQAGRTAEAIEHYRKALKVRPGLADVQLHTISLLLQTGKIHEAIQQGREAVEHVHGEPNVDRFVAWVMASHDTSDGADPRQAVELAERALAALGRRSVVGLDTLAAAYASAGRFDEAEATANEARRFAEEAGQNSLAQEIHMRLQLYRERKPYREVFPGAATTHR
jgi:tetratricopeptide (TPR) repeat protein